MDVLVELGESYLHPLRSADGVSFGPRQVTVPVDHRKIYLPLITR